MWKIEQLSDLNYLDIYQLFKLRTDVFVVEQACPYPEIDEADLTCRHGLKFDAMNQLVACFRIIDEENASRIGRVVIKKDVRGQRLGHELLELAIANCKDNQIIKIDAQSYLIKFYQKHGFEIVGEEFVEDGIPHFRMIRYPDKC